MNNFESITFNAARPEDCYAYWIEYRGNESLVAYSSFWDHVGLLYSYTVIFTRTKI